jgi:hypothetical protein
MTNIGYEMPMKLRTFICRPVVETTKESTVTPPRAGKHYGIFDNTDPPGELGSHDDWPNGEPLMKIFPADSESFGLSPSITLR